MTEDVFLSSIKHSAYFYAEKNEYKSKNVKETYLLGLD